MTNLYERILTHSALLNLFHGDPKNRDNLGRYPNDYIHHLRRWRNSGVNLQASEKHLNTLKDVDQSILACSSILSCLGDGGVTMAHRIIRNIHTERRTPTPTNTTLAGENICRMRMRYQTSSRYKTYQANTLSKSRGESKENVHCWV